MEVCKGRRVLVGVGKERWVGVSEIGLLHCGLQRFRKLLNGFWEKLKAMVEFMAEIAEATIWVFWLRKTEGFAALDKKASDAVVL